MHAKKSRSNASVDLAPRSSSRIQHQTNESGKKEGPAIYYENGSTELSVQRGGRSVEEPNKRPVKIALSSKFFTRYKDFAKLEKSASKESVIACSPYLTAEERYRREAMVGCT